MSGKIFLDTNVLVYAYDRSEVAKQAQAVAVLDSLAQSGVGVMSTQVLSEFYVTVTKKIKPPLTPQEAYNSLQRHLQVWTVVEMTGLVVLEAARGVRDHSFSLWDAQIWATARLNQIAVVFSEDFPVGATIEGVQFVNPFAADFQLDQWL